MGRTRESCTLLVLAEPSVVLQALRPLSAIWRALAGVGSVVDSTGAVLVVVSIGFGMMRSCSHARKAEFADNKRLKADLTATSSTLSMMAERGTTAEVVLLVVLTVVVVFLPLDCSN